MNKDMEELKAKKAKIEEYKKEMQKDKDKALMELQETLEKAQQKEKDQPVAAADRKPPGGEDDEESYMKKMKEMMQNKAMWERFVKSLDAQGEGREEMPLPEGTLGKAMNPKLRPGPYTEADKDIEQRERLLQEEMENIRQEQQMMDTAAENIKRKEEELAEREESLKRHKASDGSA